MSSLPQYSVVVPAAGIGKRMRADCPKQYLHIAGKTIIEHTLTNLLGHSQVKRVIVVLHAKDKSFAELPIASHPKVEVVEGGQERCDSVLAGLNYLPEDEDWVLVHDAARPCLAKSDLTALLQLATQGSSGGILATPVRDTMKRAVALKMNDQHFINYTESRENLWHALTPQFFNCVTLRRALNAATKENVQITDEASAMEHLGEKVILVEGRASNIKITQPEDLLLAEFYLTQQQKE
ncbi:2-C-methyl-D-erythritol 4-phosphate cytidylyltransferase [uncultured Paraglaciecola sp.]|uniref:2-C-methyl-D-erythritol 4-phosphate cytidylyltransferase n=1 Tax=uncultured Paraglaciecola sp. TaxID=1765024 RepID=UPI0030DC93F0|tara:strand:+ start:94901 stop:95614 length:714 start_codon:yes stop_codon:yes gene_type:complete